MVFPARDYVLDECWEVTPGLLEFSTGHTTLLWCLLNLKTKIDFPTKHPFVHFVVASEVWIECENPLRTSECDVDFALHKVVRSGFLEHSLSVAPRLLCRFCHCYITDVRDIESPPPIPCYHLPQSFTSGNMPTYALSQCMCRQTWTSPAQVLVFNFQTVYYSRHTSLNWTRLSDPYFFPQSSRWVTESIPTLQWLPLMDPRKSSLPFTRLRKWRTLSGWLGSKA